MLLKPSFTQFNTTTDPFDPQIQVTELNAWKLGPVFQHTTKILKSLSWEDITTKQKPFNYKLSSCSEEFAWDGGFQFFDVEHRTDNLHPLYQAPGTMMETDKDEDRLTMEIANWQLPCS